jgi:sec-independent protein translocase protein TatB
MFGIGSGEFLVIMVLALVLIGPQKLPDLLRAFGKGYAEFRRMTSDVRTTLEREIEKVDEARRVEATKKELFGDDAGESAGAVSEGSGEQMQAPLQAETPPPSASDIEPASAPATPSIPDEPAAKAVEQAPVPDQEKSHA